MLKIKSTPPPPPHGRVRVGGLGVRAQIEEPKMSSVDGAYNIRHYDSGKKSERQHSAPASLKGWYHKMNILPTLKINLLFLCVP